MKKTPVKKIKTPKPMPRREKTDPSINKNITQFLSKKKLTIQKTRRRKYILKYQ